ncbi:OLC1v1005859C1 [Oldenlandia corymbosa var. corymbosa]|uniref:OLC1v1005859C1 n=1 Tax=Oldenlandia corymbosa var. corymbosa TaxID=529605 RepID=A0AAV1DHM4_OLDCO|nr:OLC1v1005859C1 [Oldenlandia corymbosa var. corymbosa]
MAEQMKRLRKELRKLKDGISPLKGSGHRHAVTRNLYAEHQSTLFRGPSTMSSGTRRWSKVSNEEIDDWVVTDDVPGGPCDRSVIPSFLGHTAYQLWNGEPKDYLTIKPAKKSLSRLHGWYARLPENAQL